MSSFRFLPTFLVILVLALVSAPAFAQVSFSVSLDVAPPPLVVEDQPPCPDDGLIWTPGYWAYDDQQGAYYWVAGAWVQPPEVGLYWTPAYWGWNGNAYAFNEGYWGPSVGFYGGVNYGNGYWGNGYGGGRWDNGHFAYNTAANNVRGGHVHNTYADQSVVRSGGNRTSYNGGRGGVQAQPTSQEQQVAQNRVQPTPQQQTHFQQASQQRSHQVKVNAHPIAANANTPAANQPQASQQHTATEPAVNKPEAAFTGGNAQGPSNVNKQGGPLTGWDNQAPKKDPTADKQAAAVSNNQDKVDQKPHTLADQPAANKPEAASNHEVKMDAQPHVASEPAPATHAPQGFGPAPSVSHQQQAAAPQMQHQAPSQAPPHVEAKPQAPAEGKPEAKADGQDKQPNGQGNGH